MKTFLVLTVALLLGVSNLKPVENRVKWAYSAKRTSATEATIYIRAQIDDGWHIYSQHIEDGGPIKTKFVFSPSAEYRLAGKTTEPKAIAKFDKFFNMNVAYFEKEVIFQQKIRIQTPNKPITVKGNLAFLVCSSKNCLPPDEADFMIAIPLK